MKNIVFAGDWVLEQPVGIQRYAYQILKYLDIYIGKTQADYKIELLVPKNRSFQNKFQNIKVVRRGKIKSKLGKHIWQQLVFPCYKAIHRAIGIDLAGALPVLGCDICAVHDCIHEAYPENFIDHPKHQKIYLAKVKWLTRKKHVYIVTLTEDAKKEIQKYYSVPDDRISIVGCGWEHMREIDSDYSVLQRLSGLKKGEYFFSLGSKYKHKNFQWILETAEYNPDEFFVISGTNAYSEYGKELDNSKADNIIFTGYLTDGEIKALMENCKALIQPSLYEGFGIPPLEALSVGADIIVSKASCLPEIYGESAYYINPENAKCDLRSLMEQKVDSPEAVLDKYRWENAAKSLWQVITRV